MSTGLISIVVSPLSILWRLAISSKAFSLDFSSGGLSIIRASEHPTRDKISHAVCFVMQPLFHLPATSICFCFAYTYRIPYEPWQFLSLLTNVMVHTICTCDHYEFH